MLEEERYARLLALIADRPNPGQLHRPRAWSTLADEAGTIAISMRKLLALHGLRHGDFGVKIIEGTPTRWNCLHQGDCDAVVLGQPRDLLAMQEGYRLIGISNDAVPELL